MSICFRLFSLPEPPRKVYRQLPVTVIQKLVLEYGIVPENHKPACTQLSCDHDTEHLYDIALGKYLVAVEIDPRFWRCRSDDPGIFRRIHKRPTTVQAEVCEAGKERMVGQFFHLKVFRITVDYIFLLPEHEIREIHIDTPEKFRERRAYMDHDDQFSTPLQKTGYNIGLLRRDLLERP